MAGVTTNLTELKEKRVNLLMVLGEEVHGGIRREEIVISEKMVKLSEQIKQLDIQISGHTTTVDYNVCPKCQTKLEGEVVFCKQCGYGVKEHFAAYVKKCKCCSLPMKAEQQFCMNCGTKSDEQVEG